VLADEFHTLVPDLPGFGRSGNAIEPLTVEELAHAAAAFLDTQGIDKVTLVGNSMVVR
jgi:pimeloyl-ACP methyl ester carboxylesterase